MDFKKEKSSGLSYGKALNKAGESNGAGSIRLSAVFQEHGATYDVTLRQCFLKVKCLINADKCLIWILNMFPDYVAPCKGLQVSCHRSTLLTKGPVDFSCTLSFGHELRTSRADSVSHQIRHGFTVCLAFKYHGLLQRLIGGQWSGCRSAALAKRWWAEKAVGEF